MGYARPMHVYPTSSTSIRIDTAVFQSAADRAREVFGELADMLRRNEDRLAARRLSIDDLLTILDEKIDQRGDSCT